MMHRQKQQTPQRQRQQRKPMPTPAAKGDADSATATTLTTRGKAASAASIAVQCPQCRHRFRLLDCLLAAAAGSPAGQEPMMKAASSTSLSSPQDFRRNSGDCWQHQQHQLHMKTPNQADIDFQKDLTDNSTSLSSSPRAATAAAVSDMTLPRNALYASDANMHTLPAALSNRTPSCQSMRPSRTSGDQDLLTSEVVRNYQIVNTTIEQLEHIIMDKSDRRIRKISAISGCNIDLRSEVPAGRFGVAKNFCLLRSRSEANIDSCRGMLAKQMDWNMVVKPN